MNFSKLAPDSILNYEIKIFLRILREASEYCNIKEDYYDYRILI